MDKLKLFFQTHKLTVILGSALLVLAIGGFAVFKNINAQKGTNVEEVDLPFDAQGPYATLYPRRDGNALILNLKRTASYDAISFELAYTSRTDETTVGGKVSSPTPRTDEGDSSALGGAIDRGVVGNIDTKDKKGEYEQEILFGTCSKNVCKYDKGVENGTLTLHIKKGNQAFRMITQWHLQKPDVALGVLSSGDGHLTYKLDGDRASLAILDYSIVNDLTGVPKLPDGKEVFGKVYSLNVPIAKVLLSGTVTFELAQNPPEESKLARFNASQNKWEELDAKLEGSKFTGKASGGGIFAVLVPKK